MPDSPPPNTELKVSVLIITYNHEKYIAQAIESVLMQKTDFRYELIIGEDCSTDGTGEIVREYGRKRPEIVHAPLRERNIGARRNFRRIFAAARGKYIALLEGDDYWTSPQKLQAQADLLDAHPETSLCGHRSVWHYENGAQPDRVPSEIPGGQAGDGRRDGGERHGMIGLETDQFALQPLRAIKLALVGARRMAVAAEAHPLDEVLAVLDLRADFRRIIGKI